MKLKDRKKLLTIMEIQEVSRRELARVAGWHSHSYMNRLCNGDVDTLQPEPALRIAKFLGVGVDDLFLTKVEEKIEHSDMKTGRKKVA
ncbi:helix-turn-helix transcriptional regulator [Glutamicibacter sp. ZJUTW]|uniref:helix-turn-helix domain-containing protein n=1 Tax=Glutamicibacter sp. ZJUTW TaxID=1155384 RepID=UPI001AEFF8F2|nr:helix-turn-helix transcriptional regulator [Glutamicibacter sp. ZJUTW]